MITENNSKKEWDNFLIQNNGTFLQSTLWGDFKKKYQKVFRFEKREEGETVGVCQIFREKSRFGNYLYIPHGPFSSKKETREELFLEAVKVAKKEKDIFVNAEPIEELTSGRNSFLRIQPQKTLISNINRDIEDIKKDFSKSTKRNINYAQRKGVVIKKGHDLRSFIKLLKKTEKRQGFKSYPKDYFENLLKIPNTELVLAIYEGSVVSGTLLFYFGNTVNFLHSASDYEKRELKAPALLRFQSIVFAKEKGCKFYNFWGINEKLFPGVTKYKKSFGGTEKEYPKGKDVPVNKLRYQGMRILFSIRRICK